MTTPKKGSHKSLHKPASTPSKPKGATQDEDEKETGAADTGDEYERPEGEKPAMGSNLFDSLCELKDAVLGGDVKSMWEKLTQVGDFVFGAGDKPAMGATSPEHLGGEMGQIEQVVHEIHNAAWARQAHAVKGAARGSQPVGKWGDGTFLQILMQLLPIILAFIPK